MRTWILLLTACHHAGTDSVPNDVDADHDGYGATDDCDDDDADIHPGATESCNAKDDDCNGHVDDDPSDGLPFYPDADGDGFGDEKGVELVACDQPGGYEWNAQDCDDTRKDVHPGATEICDGIDQDCDGKTDDACS